MESSASNSSRLRLVAGLVGTAGAFVLFRLGARLSVGGAPATLPASWIDRLTLVLEPLIGILALVAAAGLWRQRRWGAIAFTVLSILIASQLALVALLVAALAAFAWRPLLIWAGMLGLALVVGYRLVRSVWRWLR